MITPINGKLQLEIEEVKVGAITTDAVEEIGTVIAAADDCSDEHKALIGKRIVYGAWAVDVRTIDGKKYYFIDPGSEAIDAIYE